MKCSRCQHENPADAKFCEECASPLLRNCSNCGAQLRANAKFCPQCAQPADAPDDSAKQAKASPTSYTPKYLADKILTSRAALEGERKQVTVLFADLTGSMELLADRDPEEARSILDPVLEHMMEAVHHYEGTVNQVMGDGIMALFGAPIAQEDHAVRACYAALRMQTAIRGYSDEKRATDGVSVQTRVGINSGEVVVRSIGSDLRMDYSAIGQTTHLAARMEQLAESGTCLITPETLRLAEGFVQVRSLGHVPVKGLSEPIETFELIGALTRRSRLQASAARGLSQFVGRKREFEVLAEAAQNARDGKGQAVAIVGEPGVGKSRLYWEFTHSHHTQGCVIVEAGSVSYGKATSFLPVIDLLKSYFEIGERDEARGVREKVTGKLLTLDRRLEALLPPLLALLDQPVNDPQWQQLDPPQRRRQTLDALKQLWLRESRNQPLVLVFEDLHWIDSETQEFLNELLDKIPASQMLLLFNYRPEYQHPWGSKTFYTQLRLDALSTESAEELLASLLGNDPGVQSLKQTLIEHTEGNPLFLEESVRALAETGQLVGDKGSYRVGRALSTTEVPATVQALLAARIDRLEVEDKRLLQTAAVIGKDVAFELLKAVSDLEESDLASGLTRLQAAEFVYEAGMFPDLEYTFKHALTHEVAYGGLTHERRRELHAGIVDAIEQTYAQRIEEHIERLAHHARRGEIWAKAVIYLRQSGQRASSRSANAEARTWWEQALAALAHLPEGEDKIKQAIDIRLELRGALFTLGHTGKAIDLTMHAQALAEQANDRYRTARALAYQVQARYFTCELDKAVAAGDRALNIATEDGYTDVQVIARLFLPSISWARGKPREAEVLFRENIEALAKVPEQARFGLPALPAVYTHCLYALMVSNSGRFPDALQWIQAAKEIAYRASHPYSQAYTCFSTCIVLATKGDFEDAIKEGEEGLAICIANGIRMFYLWVALFLGTAYAQAGRAPEGVELLVDCRDQFDRMGIPIGRHVALPRLAEAYFHVGDIDASLMTATGAVQLSRDKKMINGLPYTLELLGRIYSHPDRLDPAKAQEYFRDALQAAEEQDYRVIVAHCHAGLGRLKQSLGRQAESRKDLARARDMYRDMDMTFYLDRAQEDLAKLS